MAANCWRPYTGGQHGTRGYLSQPSPPSAGQPCPGRVGWLPACTAPPLPWQSPPMPCRIGYLTMGALDVTRRPRIENVKETLRDLGWVDGRDIVYEPRYPEQPEDMHAATNELVRLPVDLIIVAGFAQPGWQSRDQHDSHPHDDGREMPRRQASTIWRGQKAISPALRFRALTTDEIAATAHQCVPGVSRMDPAIQFDRSRT